MSPHYHHHQTVQTVVIFDRRRSFCFGHYISKLADAIIKQLCCVKTYKKKLTTAFNILHHLITEIKLIIAIIDHQNINGYHDDQIITIHANGDCVKGWLEKKGKYSRKSHEWLPLFRAHHYHQHHHQVIAINIIIKSSQSTPKKSW